MDRGGGPDVVDGAGRARSCRRGGPPGGGADCAGCPNPARYDPLSGLPHIQAYRLSGDEQTPQALWKRRPPVAEPWPEAMAVSSVFLFVSRPPSGFPRDHGVLFDLLAKLLHRAHVQRRRRRVLRRQRRRGTVLLRRSAAGAACGAGSATPACRSRRTSVRSARRDTTLPAASIRSIRARIAASSAGSGCARRMSRNSAADTAFAGSPDPPSR